MLRAVNFILILLDLKEYFMLILQNDFKQDFMFVISYIFE